MGLCWIEWEHFPFKCSQQQIVMNEVAWCRLHSSPYCAPEIFISLLKFPWCLPNPGHIKHESICCKNTQTQPPTPEHDSQCSAQSSFLLDTTRPSRLLAKIIQIFSRDNLYELFISDFLPSYSYSINSLSFSDTVKC